MTLYLPLFSTSSLSRVGDSLYGPPALLRTSLSAKIADLPNSCVRHDLGIEKQYASPSVETRIGYPCVALNTSPESLFKSSSNAVASLNAAQWLTCFLHSHSLFRLTLRGSPLQSRRAFPSLEHFRHSLSPSTSTENRTVSAIGFAGFAKLPLAVRCRGA